MEKSRSDLSQELSNKDKTIGELQIQMTATKKEAEELCTLVGNLTREKQVSTTQVEKVIKERDCLKEELASALAGKQDADARLTKETKEREELTSSF